MKTTGDRFSVKKVCETLYKAHLISKNQAKDILSNARNVKRTLEKSQNQKTHLNGPPRGADPMTAIDVICALNFNSTFGVDKMRKMVSFEA